MQTPTIPGNEQERLLALHALHILDTPAEERFDRVTRLACALLGAPISLLSLIDTDRQWFKSRQGLGVSETPRDVSFCGHAILGPGTLVVEDASRDDRFADNPLVLDGPQIRFYAGEPICSPDGAHVGTLCVIDRRPRTLDVEQLHCLRDLARIVETELARETVQHVADRLAKVTRALNLSNLKLAREQQHTLAVLEQLRIGAVVLDADEHVEFISHQGSLSLAVESDYHRHWADVLPLDELTRADVRRNLDCGQQEREAITTVIGEGGSQYWLEIEVRDAPGSAGRHILYVTDVTELHELRAARGSDGLGEEGASSSAMARLHDQVAKVARGKWTVLITGETGCGKERVARAIHKLSPRAHKPFIAVNCAGVAGSLLEGELFGHARGAFTGATGDRKGVFEAASDGTLFLDEVGDMPLSMQTALLRVLQEGEVVRLGEHVPRKVDVRLVLATHRDLEAEVDQGRFRADLLYRVRVGRVSVPSLRERQGDIRQLAATFLAAADTSARRIAPDALAALESYDWPGNVRELKAAIDFASIGCNGSALRLADLPPELRQHAPGEGATVRAVVDDGEARQRVELLDALRQAAGNRAKAARLLGIGRATFYRRLTKHGLDRRPQAPPELTVRD